MAGPSINYANIPDGWSKLAGTFTRGGTSAPSGFVGPSEPASGGSLTNFSDYTNGAGGPADQSGYGDPTRNVLFERIRSCSDVTWHRTRHS